MFSCEEAAEQAYNEAQVGVKDIDFFGLYDCFPICLVRAVEAVGLCGKGQGGQFIELKYNEILYRLAQDPKFNPQEVFPVNTHGGLQAFGLLGRQVKNARRALVYGNGGIFSHSAKCQQPENTPLLRHAARRVQHAAALGRHVTRSRLNPLRRTSGAPGLDLTSSSSSSESSSESSASASSPRSFSLRRRSRSLTTRPRP
ncbi:hypothetical protein BCR33DRAFT_783301 [Rhizoclosmatium globosum]|uniref:Thiolase C-terminal domain-containing protein n=1 Tax=Rhizoclosmatium globosum TaxID=329046 RepID=A0A1Y2CIV3_9FUNG|nr:hypothetical protein BCR33DRAFT_783301 [Rhizoclosmatium globosum]|eukprot:ORY46837.1 hypothetical protein BCR33DRAFT_783301 [Rhizoclosmatium globosum]